MIFFNSMTIFLPDDAKISYRLLARGFYINVFLVKLIYLLHVDYIRHVAALTGEKRQQMTDMQLVLIVLPKLVVINVS